MRFFLKVFVVLTVLQNIRDVYFYMNCFGFYNTTKDAVYTANFKNIKEPKKTAANQKQSISTTAGDFGVSARNGAILMDARTKDILFSQNAHICAPMASTTKIMTALIAIENTSSQELDEKHKVNKEAVSAPYLGGTSLMGLLPGDVVSMRQLLYGMLLNSGNEAANEIAVRVAKKIVSDKKVEGANDLKANDLIGIFVKHMNEKAKQMGLKDTMFSSPSGLGPEDVIYIQGSDNKSTAKDLGLLTCHAMKHKIFCDITSTAYKCLEIENVCDFSKDNDKTNTSKNLNESKKTNKNKNVDRSKTTNKNGNANKPEPIRKLWLTNHNKLIRKGKGCYYKYACGVKTGFTDKAGRCLVGAAKDKDITLVSVVLKDPDDWMDTRRMFDYGFSKYKTVNLPKEIHSNEVAKIRLLKIGEADKYFGVTPKEDIKISVTEKMNNKQRLTYKILAEPIYFHNIKKGEKVGKMEYYLDNMFIGETDLLAENDVF